MSQVQEFHILQIQDRMGSRMVHLDAAAYSIGRDTESNAIVVADSAVSRNHALLYRMPMPDRKYVYQLVDGDCTGRPSRNGVFVNTRPCTKAILKTGDQILIGDSTRLSYLLAKMTPAEFQAYFKVEPLNYRSIKDESLDPTGTLMTLLQDKAAC